MSVLCCDEYCDECCYGCCNEWCVVLSAVLSVLTRSIRSVWMIRMTIMHHCSCNRSEFHFPFNPSQECDSSSSGRSRGRAMSSALRVLRKVHSSELDGPEGGNRLLGCVGVARHSSLTYSPPLGCSRHCEHAGACSERDVPSRRKGQQSAAWYINLFSINTPLSELIQYQFREVVQLFQVATIQMRG